MPPATRHCKDANRQGDFEHASFDFLGYTFRGRLAKGPRGYFTGFSPAISATAKKAKGKQIRDWHLNRRSGTDLSGLAREINPRVQGSPGVAWLSRDVALEHPAEGFCNTSRRVWCSLSLLIRNLTRTDLPHVQHLVWRR